MSPAHGMAQTAKHVHKLATATNAIPPSVVRFVVLMAHTCVVAVPPRGVQVLLTQVQDNPYVHDKLADLETFEEVVDEIYNVVDHLQPFMYVHLPGDF